MRDRDSSKILAVIGIIVAVFFALVQWLFPFEAVGPSPIKPEVNEMPSAVPSRAIDHTPIPTLTIHNETPFTSLTTPQSYFDELIGGPYLEHRTAYVGTGVFEEVTFSDGNAPYNWGNEDIYYFWSDHPDLIKIIGGHVTEQNRCGIAPFDANKVWTAASNGAVFTVNNVEIGRVTSSIKSNHGFIVPSWLVHKGDEICIGGLPESESFHVIFGPAIYYLYDSYCTNRVCY